MEYNSKVKTPIKSNIFLVGFCPKQKIENFIASLLFETLFVIFIYEVSVESIKIKSFDILRNVVVDNDKLAAMNQNYAVLRAMCK